MNEKKSRTTAAGIPSEEETRQKLADALEAWGKPHCLLGKEATFLPKGLEEGVDLQFCFLPSDGELTVLNGEMDRQALLLRRYFNK